MAKKAVASLQTGAGRTQTKCIKMGRSPKTGAFVFKEEMVPNAEVKAYFKDAEYKNILRGLTPAHWLRGDAGCTPAPRFFLYYVKPLGRPIAYFLAFRSLLG